LKRKTNMQNLLDLADKSASGKPLSLSDQKECALACLNFFKAAVKISLANPERRCDTGILGEAVELLEGRLVAIEAELKPRRRNKKPRLNDFAYRSAAWGRA
jgi:hypothetical protein